MTFADQKDKVCEGLDGGSSLETSTFEELGSEFIYFACNCVINTLRLIVY